MSNEQSCQDRRESIVALVLGELDAAEAEELGRHIESCSVCRGVRDALAGEEEMVRSTFDAIARGVEPIEQLVERFGESGDQSDTHAATPTRRLIGGFRTMKRSYKLLAAAAAIVIAFTGLTSWLIPGGRSNGLAFGDVLKQIREFRPYSCLYTHQYEGRKYEGISPVSYRLMRPDVYRRRELRPDGRILVFDLSQTPRKSLILFPDRKFAFEETYLGSQATKDRNILEMVAEMRDGTAEDLGVKEVDGKLAHGFHRPDKINDTTIWADPKTGLPIRIEWIQRDIPRTITVNEFDFDVDFDESLFSTTAPEGYTVQRVERNSFGVTNFTEEQLIEWLQVTATVMGGAFPAVEFPAILEDPAVQEALFQKVVEQIDPAPSAEEMESLQFKAERALGYLRVLQLHLRVKDLTYAGEGVKLGDAQTPILWWMWWHRPGGMYRAIYGDLSARDVSPDQLPAAP